MLVEPGLVEYGLISLAFGSLVVVLLLSRHDLAAVIRATLQSRARNALLIALLLAGSTLLVNALDLPYNLLPDSLVRGDRTRLYLIIASLLSLCSAFLWWRRSKAAEKVDPFSNIFLRPGFSLDECLLVVLLLSPIFQLLTVYLPPTRAEVIVKLAGAVTGHVAGPMKTMLDRIEDREDLHDVYWYYYGWYLRHHGALVLEPDVAFARVPESSDLFFEAQRARVSYANSFKATDRSQWRDRLAKITDDMDNTTLGGTAYHYYALLLLDLDSGWAGKASQAGDMYTRFLVRYGDYVDFGDFSLRKEPEVLAAPFNLFRLADAIPAYALFNYALASAEQSEGRHFESQMHFAELQRQISALGRQQFCWHFMDSFRASKLCQHIVAVAEHPHDPSARGDAYDWEVAPCGQFQLQLQDGTMMWFRAAPKGSDECEQYWAEVDAQQHGRPRVSESPTAGGTRSEPPAGVHPD